MPHHREKRILPYSAQQMYDLVADIGRYPEFLPWCKGARILSRTEKGVEADLIVGTKLFREKFTSVVTLDKPRAIVVEYKAGPLSNLSNEWAFKPMGRKSCEVSFDLDFDFRSPLLRAAMGAVFERALGRMIEAFEARARALYDR
ncbi:MAG: type II toxin-antitoxin system RatA family toxin [Alphaproteobacteria bacterium]|nr:type II toxin-antitoxin system RatA family toxin [Alphaproteobacteria bacterium]